VEGVVNEDVAVHAEQMSTLRTCIRHLLCVFSLTGKTITLSV